MQVFGYLLFKQFSIQELLFLEYFKGLILLFKYTHVGGKSATAALQRYASSRAPRSTILGWWPYQQVIFVYLQLKPVQINIV